MSDNGSGFTSLEFRQFLSANGVKQILTSPYHPSSNGLAERVVQTFKATVSKLIGPMEVRLSRFLFKYRITPQTTTGISPAELLMGRRLRSHLDLLHPDTESRIRAKQESSLDVKGTVRQFKVGDLVYVKTSPEAKWSAGKIVGITGPVSYQVETSEGLVKRHVDYIRSRCEDSVRDRDRISNPTLMY